MTATETEMTKQVATSTVNLRVYNTLTRKKEAFQPVTPGKVGIYLCGPTVYKEAHIGHMVGPVIFDTIKRYLTYCGFEVQWVVNITDVDDKLINEGNRRGIPMDQVAQEMTADYLASLKALNVNQIDALPKATDHIDEICQFIQQLVDHGFAYESEGDVYFEVNQDGDYGKLSNRSADSQQGEGGETVGLKRAPGDFALWKKAKPGEPSWSSAWGAGRPGWHIECSAMSRKVLGETFDIHGGGLDLIFPHHENEIAQSECCHSKPMAKYWMHNGLMKASSSTGKVGGRGERETKGAAASGKISRSEGAGGLADLIAQQSGERIRFFLLRTHYRSTIIFGEDGLDEAGIALDSFYRFFERFRLVTGEDYYAIDVATKRGPLKTTSDDPLLVKTANCRDEFLAKMDDDFNTGGAVSELFELVRALNKYVDEHGLEDRSQQDSARLKSFRQGATTLKELSHILGLFQTPVETVASGDDQLAGQLMELLIGIRADARTNKDFATSDRIRDTLAEIGVSLEDRKDGTIWRRQS